LSQARRVLGSLKRALHHASKGSDAAPSDLHKAVLEIERSRTFQRYWYERQSHHQFASDRAAIRHYLERGISLGLEPTALFCSSWYCKEQPGGQRAKYGALVHYLRKGRARGVAPHPLFDVEHYRSQTEEAEGHPGGDLGHYLEVGWKEGLSVNDWFGSQSDATEPAIVGFLERFGGAVRSIPDHRAFPQLYGRFDLGNSDRLVARALSDPLENPPLVTVIMTVRDGASTVGAAIRSVLDQTHADLELIVVDDGSLDGTTDVVRSFDDPRIELVSLEPHGVASARNVGLARARGSYIAYLDSDNQWSASFLQVLVRHLKSGDADAAYSAIEVLGDETTAYRGAPIEVAPLLEANYVDINSLVHHRRVIDRIGTWDETLPGANDWDFVLRLVAAGAVDYVPFIGMRVGHDTDRGDRIGGREPSGHKYRVYVKHNLDWAGARRDTVQGRISVVVWHTGRVGRLAACVEALEATAADADLEILVIDDSANEEHLYRLLAMQQRYERLRVIRPTRMKLFASVALNYGILHATGEIVVFLDQRVSVQPGWLRPLVDPIYGGEAVAAQSVISTRAGTVASAGYLLPPNGLPYPAFNGFPGQDAAVNRDAHRSGLSRELMAVRRSDLLDVEGFDASYRVAFADVDLTLRLSEVSGLAARFAVGPGGTIAGSPLAHDEEVLEQDQTVFLERWLNLSPDEAQSLAATGLRSTGRVRRGERDAAPDAYEPVIDWIRDRERPLRWAIKIAARNTKVSYRWGDTHFAQGLRAALQDLGHEVIVDLRDAWYRPTAHLDDVVLVLRGLTRYRPNPDQVNLLWMISHPDWCSEPELARFDRQFVASDLLARKYSRRFGTDVQPLLQCTDITRFRPLSRSMTGERILFVGNSRGVRRPIIDDAIATGLDVRVYGSLWDDLIPSRNIAGTFIPNEGVAESYASAGVVLNDHWEDMRREQIMSNRLFDLAACAANVVSDHVRGMEAVFGKLVRTYEHRDQLPEVIEEALRCREDEREARIELAETIRKRHSFDVRAKDLDRAARAVLGSRR
jgi:O-antigen biosynthesis protein